MMTCQEMATAAHYRLRLTVIVIDNARLGTIRAHQEREYPGRVSSTGLTNPDFCAFARSFGAHATRADGLEAFKTALAEARARGGLNLIEVPLDARYLSPGKTL
jgi:acetolactate synthase-1/2/3 large subunit